MYLIYSFLLFLSLIIYIPVYFVKLKLRRKESLHIKERFGFGIKSREEGGRSIWIHAVSVGEVLSLQNFVAKLKKEHPDWKIYFSSLTNTGIKVARDKLAAADLIFYVPFDFKWVVQKFFRILKPDIFILAESEFWPNMLREAKKSTRGTILINGRISQNSYSRYRRIKLIVKRILGKINLFLVQAEIDKKRLIDIAVCPDSIQVVGNLKADIDLPLLTKKEQLDLKRHLNIPEEKILLLAGSIHKGEDTQVVEAFAMAKKKRRELRMIIAPRHLERVSEIDNLCRQYGLTVLLKTRVEPGKKWDVLILDTMGELAQLYTVCDLAFIGGSLIPWGGQNLLEPAFYGKPVFFGPHMDNFLAITEKFLQSGAAEVCPDKDALEKMLIQVDRVQMSEMGKKARLTLDSIRGATNKTLSVVEKLMNV